MPQNKELQAMQVSSHLDATCFEVPNSSALNAKPASTHRPRILMLYGSLRERSYSKLLTLEAAKLLEAMGADVQVFILWACRSPTRSRNHIPKFKRCVSWRPGQKAWSGVHQSDTAQ